MSHADTELVSGVVSPTTPLPPWALPEAEPGQGSRERTLPAPLHEQLQRVAQDPAALERLMLSAWLAVLSRCVGEPDVVTACFTPDGTAVCVQGRVADTGWSALGDALRHTPLHGRPDSAVDLYGAATSDAADLLIRFNVADGHLRITHTARVSRIAAERVLGYLVFALTMALSEPDATADLAEMLSDEERRYQLEDLCGPRIDNGPDGFVSAFRARVAAHPARFAVHHGTDALTYAELDAASERVALHLRSQGVTAEQAVAVVSGRHPAWVVALLGVLKAGAVYLPVRPDFPPSRVEDQLARAECTVALADADGGSLMSAVSESAWSGVVLPIDDLLSREADGVELPTPALHQNAYVYFTSGSTGRPKGAVCAHDGMINHLWAKVDDHDLGPEDVVAQTASPCFDISLWQVCAPLLVGGATVIVDTEQQLTVEDFAQLLIRHRVSTIQIVPSYLEVLLTHLEAGAVELPRLKSVSVTGEALKSDLVHRWFAVVPGVRLINAYGATEVSDDTMHEILDGPPRRDLAIVNVGRPLRNMRVYVVDDRQRLMPQGARGEIVFAGVCVGRGYVNDPERTAEVFLPDPYFPGEALYRSGDMGRWLPEGRLEFLGRRDDQIKIRGLRVEIGEIQAALQSVPGISAAAVVPVGEGNGRRLVAFYVSADDLTEIDLHDLLSARLPAYMVPAHHFRVPELPLNDNGKTDRTELQRLAGALAADRRAFEPPTSPAEQRLATLWAEVLGMAAGRVGRYDDFFELGGTSLSAIHLLLRLEHRLAMADLLNHSVLADQAEILSAAGNAVPVRHVHELSGAGTGRPELLCLPDAGGNAINFQRLAEAAGDRLQVLAVELPGHDLARPHERLISLPRLAEHLADELRGRSGLYLWGQGAGAAATILTAQALERSGIEVGGVIVALEDADPLATVLSDDEVADRLRRRRAYVEFDGVTTARLAFVARAWRHDWAEAEQAFEGFGGDFGLACPVIELTLDPTLPSAPTGVTPASSGPDGGIDIARHNPDLIVDVIDRHHGSSRIRS
ncbi:non-ribosomal peptide synthetase family protein [Nonomuraea sp. NPDC004354]